jgi:hypothetical protein
MKRLVKVLSPIALLAVFVIGATPSAKTAADAGALLQTSPEMTPSVEVVVPPQLETPVVSTDASAQPIQPEAAAGAAAYAIDWYSINGGGTVNATSTNYQMGASIGQSVAGAGTSTNYQMGIGFWYGAGATGGGGCVCDCHGDPAPIGACDGVQDILDVVQTVNVAFRGAAAILDPNAACPYETTDTNCSLSTDVIDVVKVVNVAFRGANAATEFCNSCP